MRVVPRRHAAALDAARPRAPMRLEMTRVSRATGRRAPAKIARRVTADERTPSTDASSSSTAAPPSPASRWASSAAGGWRAPTSARPRGTRPRSRRWASPSAASVPRPAASASAWSMACRSSSKAIRSVPIARGRLCAKGQAAIEAYFDPDRLVGPARRVGPRGDGRWEPISWAAATGCWPLSLTRRAAHRRRDPGLRRRGARPVRRGVGHVLDGRRARVWRGRRRRTASQLRDRFEVLTGVAADPLFDVEHATYVLSFGAPLVEDWLSPRLDPAQLRPVPPRHRAHARPARARRRPAIADGAQGRRMARRSPPTARRRSPTASRGAAPREPDRSGAASTGWRATSPSSSGASSPATPRTPWRRRPACRS